MADFDPDYTPEFTPELRLYSFVNFYLSSIQQGIQTGHAAVDLVRKYSDRQYPMPNGEFPKWKDIELVEDWADNHKTFVILNGGANIDMQNVLDLTAASDFPWEVFLEDHNALGGGGIMTCVAVVLPDWIFNLRPEKNIHDETYYSWTRQLNDGGVIIYSVGPKDAEYEFVKMLKSKGLAR